MSFLKKIGAVLLRLAKNRAVIAAVSAAAGASGSETVQKVAVIAGQIVGALPQ